MSRLLEVLRSLDNSRNLLSVGELPENDFPYEHLRTVGVIEMLFNLTPARFYSGGPTQTERRTKICPKYPLAYFTFFLETPEINPNDLLVRELWPEGKDPEVSSTRQLLLQNGENR